MHHDTFNADFYVVAATVIPLLYITLTLQGTTYESFLKRMKAYDDRGSPWVSWPSFISRWSRWSLFYWLSFLMWYAGIGGEFMAIFALYTRSSGAIFQVITLFSTWLLILTIGIGPFQRFIAANRNRAHEISRDEEKQSSE